MTLLLNVCGDDDGGKCDGDVMIMVMMETNRQEGPKEPTKGIAGDHWVHVSIVHHS